MGRLISFITLFICIYGSFHLYLLLKIRRAFYLGGPGFVLLALVLAFLMLAPIQARLLAAHGGVTSSLILTWIGYLWLGLLFIFICVALPLDVYHLGMSALQNLLNTDLTNLMLSRRQALALTAVAAAGIMIYGAWAARQIRIEQVVLASPKIPASANGLRIIQISDVHLGPMLYPGRLAGIVAAVESARPDILVSTGDLVDGHLSESAEDARLIKSIPAPLGKFAVTGNHEFYAGIPAAVSFTEQAGFRMLRGSLATVNDFLTIAGVDDTAGGPTAATDEKRLLSSIPGGHFTLLLKHRPLVDAAVAGKFDLQLSGHTHRGQIFPFTLVIDWTYPFLSGLYDIASGGRIYVSRGTGTWGPPVRVLAPPEVTVFELRSR